MSGTGTSSTGQVQVSYKYVRHGYVKYRSGTGQIQVRYKYVRNRYVKYRSDTGQI
jgi:hypothetical protein